MLFAVAGVKLSRLSVPRHSGTHPIHLDIDPFNPTKIFFCPSSHKLTCYFGLFFSLFHWNLTFLLVGFPSPKFALSFPDQSTPENQKFSNPCVSILSSLLVFSRRFSISLSSLVFTLENEN